MEATKTQKNISKKSVLKGKIVSAKMKDSVVVSVETFKKHPKYGKYFNISKKIMAHDPGNKHKEGEIVEIVQVRPISKRKSFAVVEK